MVETDWKVPVGADRQVLLQNKTGEVRFPFHTLNASVRGPEKSDSSRR